MVTGVGKRTEGAFTWFTFKLKYTAALNIVGELRVHLHVHS